MEASFMSRHPFIKDAVNITIFIVCVLVGTLFINTFVFRSFSVVGPSMESTLYTGDRLIISRLPVTWTQLQNKTYTPNRGQIVVFKNPKYTSGIGDEYIVKRVIAFPGERVVLKSGKFTVYNNEHPNGFDPDVSYKDQISSYTTGSIDLKTVPDNELFVAGDHREGTYSFDSRNGLGTIPLYDVVGPVGVRIFPFNKIRFF
jgi:signal peptidase I